MIPAPVYSLSSDYFKNKKVDSVNIKAWDEYHSGGFKFLINELKDPVLLYLYPLKTYLQCLGLSQHTSHP